MTPEEFSEILKNIESGKITGALDLSNKCISDVQVSELIKALAKNPTITNLNLAFNRIISAGAITLAENSTLTSLNLEGNNLGNTGAIALVKNHTFTSLHLKGNHIGDTGAIASAQNSNPYLAATGV